MWRYGKWSSCFNRSKCWIQLEMDKCNVQSRHWRFFLRGHVICNAQGFCGAEWKGADAPQKPKCDGRCRQVPNVSVVQDDFLAITEFKLIWWHQTHRKDFWDLNFGWNTGRFHKLNGEKTWNAVPVDPLQTLAGHYVLDFKPLAPPFRATTASEMGIAPWLRSCIVMHRDWFFAVFLSFTFCISLTM